MKFLYAGLCCEERRTFRLHLSYSIIEGFILGVLALNEFVFIKSLQGSNYQLGVLFQFSMLVFLLLLFVNEFLKRIRKRRVFLRWVGILTRLPLMLLFFFPRSSEALTENSFYHLIFLTVFLVYYLAAPVVNPTINLLLRANYQPQNFGKLYSIATSVNKIVLMVVTFLYGLLLDFNNFIFVYIFPIVSVMGMASIFLLSKINYTPPGSILIKETVKKSILRSVSNMIELLRNNRPYLHFEVSFMLYGMAFMLSTPVITIFFYNALDLNYSSVAFYRNAYNILAIFILPFFGKMIGKTDPRKFGVITFSSLVLFLFFLMITLYFPYHFEFYGIKLYITLIPYVVFHGVFAGTMVLLWNIGSAYFGKVDEADIYQSTHLFLTGVRALFAPLFGIYLYELLGFSITFLLAILLTLSGISLLIWSYKIKKRR
ncbi:MAG: MFS transporter [Sphingobacteriia bacterium]|nr:MFS transporter [Sphingobacteriia bacterium]